MYWAVMASKRTPPAVLIASSRGRIAVTVMGSDLMAVANCIGSLMASLLSSSYKMLSLMPSRFKRLDRWLDREREPRGWLASRSTLAASHWGNKSKWKVALPWAAMRSRRSLLVA